MKLLTEYLEHARCFEQMAAEEKSEIREQFEQQAAAYRKSLLIARQGTASQGRALPSVIRLNRDSSSPASGTGELAAPSATPPPDAAAAGFCAYFYYCEGVASLMPEAALLHENQQDHQNGRQYACDYHGDTKPKITLHDLELIRGCNGSHCDKTHGCAHYHPCPSRNPIAPATSTSQTNERQKSNVLRVMVGN